MKIFLAIVFSFIEKHLKQCGTVGGSDLVTLEPELVGVLGVDRVLEVLLLIAVAGLESSCLNHTLLRTRFSGTLPSAHLDSVEARVDGARSLLLVLRRVELVEVDAQIAARLRWHTVADCRLANCSHRHVVNGA